MPYTPEWRMQRESTARSIERAGDSFIRARERSQDMQFQAQRDMALNRMQAESQANARRDKTADTLAIARGRLAAFLEEHPNERQKISAIADDPNLSPLQQAAFMTEYMDRYPLRKQEAPAWSDQLDKNVSMRKAPDGSTILFMNPDFAKAITAKNASPQSQHSYYTDTWQASDDDAPALSAEYRPLEPTNREIRRYAQMFMAQEPGGVSPPAQPPQGAMVQPQAPAQQQFQGGGIPPMATGGGGAPSFQPQPQTPLQAQAPFSASQPTPQAAPATAQAPQQPQGDRYQITPQNYAAFHEAEQKRLGKDYDPDKADETLYRKVENMNRIARGEKPLPPRERQDPRAVEAERKAKADEEKMIMDMAQQRKAAHDSNPTNLTPLPLDQAVRETIELYREVSKALNPPEQESGFTTVSNRQNIGRFEDAVARRGTLMGPPAPPPIEPFPLPWESQPSGTAPQAQPVPTPTPAPAMAIPMTDPLWADINLFIDQAMTSGTITTQEQAVEAVKARFGVDMPSDERMPK